jgi:hypothetical protein
MGSVKKICRICKTMKDYSEFGKQIGTKDGYRGECKRCNHECHRNRINTHPDAFLRNKYGALVSRCQVEERYIGKLHITREEFLQWGIPALQDFVDNNRIDVSDGYLNKDISIDKIIDDLGYTLGNLQFLLGVDNTKKMNQTRGTLKKVCQYSKEGKFINRYDSIDDASRALCGDISKSPNINRALKSRCLSAYGYIWKYSAY